MCLAADVVFKGTDGLNHCEEKKDLHNWHSIAFKVISNSRHNRCSISVKLVEFIPVIHHGVRKLKSKNG